jgi:hypothetical protein
MLDILRLRVLAAVAVHSSVTETLHYSQRCVGNGILGPLHLYP